MSLQLVRPEKSQGLHCSNSILQLVVSLRSDEVIWLHAYMTGRVHALMPATHLQMSGQSMGTQSSGAGGCCECLQRTERTSKRHRDGILDPYLWSHLQYMRAPGVSSDDSP